MSKGTAKERPFDQALREADTKSPPAEESAGPSTAKPQGLPSPSKAKDKKPAATEPAVAVVVPVTIGAPATAPTAAVSAESASTPAQGLGPVQSAASAEQPDETDSDHHGEPHPAAATSAPAESPTAVPAPAAAAVPPAPVPTQAEPIHGAKDSDSTPAATRVAVDTSQPAQEPKSLVQQGPAADPTQGTPQPHTALSPTPSVHANPNAHPAASAATPPPVAPRTIDPTVLHTAEQARNSVFDQIALRVHDRGGEMRVLLNPPELGQLDVRMVVDHRGTMRLDIVAERPELTAMLEKHVNELREHLAQQGLTVSEASISSREQHDGRRTPHEHPEPEWLADTRDGEGSERAEPVPTRTINLSGLDFLV